MTEIVTKYEAADFGNAIYMENEKDSISYKLKILADAAKYDVACTSSGVDRKGKEGYLGNSCASGICHSFASDGRCISLLKILMTNHCEYDCKYCINRKSNDVPRATFSPEEICQLTIEFYKRNYIEGLFLSSGVLKNPTYTMEKMCETLSLLRNKYRFNGYIHVKTIPGAGDEMLALAGHLADRISINMELPTAESLKKLAPNKSFQTIVTPMQKVSDSIADHRAAVGKDRLMERSRGNLYLPGSIFREKQVLESRDRLRALSQDSVMQAKASGLGMERQSGYGQKRITGQEDSIGVENLFVHERQSGYGIMPYENIQNETGSSTLSQGDSAISRTAGFHNLSDSLPIKDKKRPFAPAGQSTQMIIGASGESDFNLISITQSLYQAYDLKRVFYSAYIPLNEDPALPALDTKPPLLREHRLYQADWLMRFYGFQANELLSEEKPDFNVYMDPKCDWALRHLGDFPVEVMTAPYDKIVRVPGIGPKSAKRIVTARRYGKLDYDILKKMGVVLKRAHYFITCSGKMMFNTPIDEGYITRQMIGLDRSENWRVQHQNENYRQMSLFDMGLSV